MKWRKRKEIEKAGLKEIEIKETDGQTEEREMKKIYRKIGSDLVRLKRKF